MTAYTRAATLCRRTVLAGAAMAVLLGIAPYSAGAQDVSGELVILQWLGGTEAEMWKKVEEAFSEDRAIMIIDMSGYTRSTQSGRLIPFLLMVNQMRQLAEPVIEEHGGLLVRAEYDNLTSIFDDVDVSPSGEYVLVSRTLRPYSYLVPAARFPKEIEVWNLRGEVVRRIAQQPLAENIPIRGVRTGPRAVNWRPDVPATLAWTEALDGGDPKSKVEHQDHVVMLAAPFTGEPTELLRLWKRFGGIQWDSGGRALVGEYDRERRWSKTWLVDASRPGTIKTGAANRMRSSGSAPGAVSRSNRLRPRPMTASLYRSTSCAAKAAANASSCLMTDAQGPPRGSDPKGLPSFLTSATTASTSANCSVIENSVALSRSVSEIQPFSKRMLAKAISRSRRTPRLVWAISGNTNSCSSTPVLSGIASQARNGPEGGKKKSLKARALARGQMCARVRSRLTRVSRVRLRRSIRPLAAR